MTEISSPYETYREHCRRGALMHQTSLDGTAVFYPRLVAPGTGETALVWRESCGRGTVYATTVIRPRRAEPYNVVLVELDEGFTMMSRVDGVEPEKVEIGMRVEVRMEPVGDDGEPWPVFVPASGRIDGEG
ncbi:MAG: hypothetical protein GEV10_24240 [Streptosporangiales bacterium]|nr:hypothetical protein [Streptosporangiales bacterium]